MPDPNETVVDPQLSGKAAAILRAASRGSLIPFAASELPRKRTWHAGRTAWLLAGTGAILMAVYFLVAGGYGASEGLQWYWLLVSYAGSLAIFAALWTAVRYRRTGRWTDRVAAAARAHHRRYVVPGPDLDKEARRLWSRAAGAADLITGSRVVQEGLIDSIRVSAVLPHHLWDIAEKLALLSALRREHRGILSGMRTDDPDIAVVLSPQRRTHDLAVADAERQTSLLEAFAGQVKEADAAVRREDAIRRLATLNDSHADLLARIGRPGEDDQITDLTSRDARAVIERANEAVRSANEAGRSLIIPGTS